MSSAKRLTPERRRDMTRQHLLDAAAEVFADRGYERASVDDIAEAAGFTKGAVYSNFGSKEELFLALVRHRQDAMLVEFFAAGDQPADDSVASLLEAYQRLAPDPKEWKLWMEFTAYALRKPELAQRLRDDGDRAREQLAARLAERMRALPAPPLSAPVLARLYTAIFDGVNQQRAIDPDGVDDDLFPTLVRFVDDAIEALSSR